MNYDLIVTVFLQVSFIGLLVLVIHNDYKMTGKWSKTFILFSISTLAIYVVSDLRTYNVYTNLYMELGIWLIDLAITLQLIDELCINYLYRNNIAHKRLVRAICLSGWIIVSYFIVTKYLNDLMK